MKTRKLDITERTITLNGLTPIMFDRYSGDNKTQLPVEAKMYFMEDGKTLCIPAANLISFLCAKNSTSVVKLIGGKSWGKISDAILSYVGISPNLIPILRNGIPIVFNGFEDGKDPLAKISVDTRTARLPKGIPNLKIRPVLDLEWSIIFNLTIYKNDEVDELFLQTCFVRGGMQLGLGTFRGVFGKFNVLDWK